ncbi:MAG: hypothetical protein ACMUHY_07030 [Thermoplasmatota archaeon]
MEIEEVSGTDDLAGRIKLRKGAGWTLTSLGWVSIVISVTVVVALMVILSVVLIEGEKLESGEGEDNSFLKPGPLIGLAYVLVLFFLMGAITGAMVSIVFSIFLIKAGKYMRQGRNRVFVTVIIVIGSLMAASNLLNMLEFLKEPGWTSAGGLLISLFFISIWGFVVYALAKSWRTFEVK